MSADFQQMRHTRKNYVSLGEFGQRIGQILQPLRDVERDRGAPSGIYIRIVDPDILHNCLVFGTFLILFAFAAHQSRYFFPRHNLLQSKSTSHA